MTITDLDHVVFNVADVERSLSFYRDRLGLHVERLDEFRAGSVKLPSLRINARTVIDLFPPAMHGDAPRGVNVNHIALTVTGSIDDVADELARVGITVEQRSEHNFGAQGYASSLYIRDPDGNSIELRVYGDGG